MLDAESGLDSITDVGISDGVIQSLETDIDPNNADDVIDASGKWVIPGMIDTHVHVELQRRRNGESSATGHTYGLGLQMLASAGATTVIDLGGSMDTLRMGIEARGSGINVGSLGYLKPGETVPEGRINYAQIEKVINTAMDAGSIGVKLLGGYYPFTPEETSNFIKAANEMTAYVAFHLGTTETGSRLDGLREIPSLLGANGRVHIAHINAYCRGSILPVEEEIIESLQILTDVRSQIVSEVHLARPNFTLGKCDPDGNVLADVCQNCLRLKGYATTADGLRSALMDGYASTVEETRTGLILVSGKRGVELFNEGNTDVQMSFPVNNSTSAFQLTVAKNSEDEFIIDAVGSDAGILPRNVNIEQCMQLVKFGGLEPLELVVKLSLNPAKMIGLENKGRLSEGNDGDLTIIDPIYGRAVYGVVAGRLVMIDGRVVGNGAKILTTQRGVAAVEETGIPYQVIDLTKAMMYAGR